MNPLKDRSTAARAASKTTSAETSEPLAAYKMPPRRPAWRRALATSPFYMGCVLLAMLAVFSLLKPDAFPTVANARNITLDVAMLQVMAVGMTFVIVAGGFDISIGSILVFSGVVAGKFMENRPDTWSTVIIGTLVCILSGLAWGLWNGWCIAKLKVPPLITTLGTLGAALGAAQLMTNGADLRTVPTTLFSVTRSRPLGLSWLVWIAIVLSIVCGLILAFTRYGRHTYLIGSNIESARRAGINVDRHVISLYALNGALAGLAGMVSLTRFSTTTISGHSTDALQVITGVVLGGTSVFGGLGTLIGTSIGILIPAVLTNGFVVLNFQPFGQQIVIGAVLVGAVYLDQLRRRRRDRI
ncbi:MAG: ABC transporter permease [Mycobacteriales bacterium]